MDLYHIYSVIKYKHIGITDKRNALAMDGQGQLDHLPSLDQLEALHISFKIKKEGCLPCLMLHLLHNVVVRRQQCTESSSNRTAPFPVRINVS
jgi:hypothetical protein